MSDGYAPSREKQLRLRGPGLFLLIDEYLELLAKDREHLQYDWYIHLTTFTILVFFIALFVLRSGSTEDNRNGECSRMQQVQEEGPVE